MNLKFIICVFGFCSIAFGQSNSSKDESEDWSIHFQETNVLQMHDIFHAPYTGLNSLLPSSERKMSVTSTFFLGRRLWKGAAFYINPEAFGGEGLSQTVGLAGAPNGETYRISNPAPHISLARLYLEQAFGLGDELEDIESEQNQLKGKLPVKRLTLRLGKMSMTDYFDDNKYSHDPRTQFLNWSIMADGAWDYPADTRGYTNGIMADLNLKDWNIQYGIFQMPQRANQMRLDYNIKDANGQALEIVRKYSLSEHPGAARFMGYANHANMGNYTATIDTPAFGMDITKSEMPRRSKYGLGLNLEQELAKDLGAFLRAGWSDGRNETFAFTEIDRTISGGISYKGSAWNRPDDTLGVAFAVNGLSPQHATYLAKGGFGFIIGDGKLNYGSENILETYYSVKIYKGIFASLDYQFVDNPAYNRDRGPVSIFGIRLHFEF